VIRGFVSRESMRNKPMDLVLLDHRMVEELPAPSSPLSAAALPF
jgi:hypothetical protein